MTDKTAIIYSVKFCFSIHMNNIELFICFENLFGLKEVKLTQIRNKALLYTEQKIIFCSQNRKFPRPRN